MKKIILCLVLFIFGLVTLTGCLNPYSENGTTAKDLLYAMYKDDSEATAANYNVVGRLVANGEAFEVTWEVEVTEGDENGVKVEKAADPNKGYTVVVDKRATADIKYVLTGKIMDTTGYELEQSFNHYVPKFEINTFDEWLESCKNGDGKNLTIKGNVIGIVGNGSSSAGSIYFQDADGHGYYAYNPKNKDDLTGLKFGDEIIVTGTGTVYSGQYEFNAGCTVEVTSKSVEELTYTDATALWEAASGQNDTNLIPFQNSLVKLVGCTMANIDGSYYYFTVGNGKAKFNLYDTYYFLDDTSRKAITSQWEAGKVCDIYGIVSCYSNLYQIYPISAEALKNVSLPKKTDAEAVEFVKSGLELNPKFDEAAEVTVPTSGYSDQVTITWASEDETAAKFENGKLIVTLGDDAKKVKVTATLTAGDVTDTKEFTLEIAASSINYITAQMAIELCEKLDAASKETSKDKYYVLGTIVDDPTADYCNFNFKAGEKSIKVYGLYTPDGTKRYGTKRDISELPVKKGDQVLVFGNLQNFTGTLEITNAKLIPAGSTYANPFNAEQAIAECEKLDAASKETSKDKYYVLGTIVDDPTADYCNFNFKAGEKSIKVYGLYTQDGSKRYGTKRDISELPVKKGDQVLLFGNLQNFTGTLEITNARLIPVGTTYANPYDAAIAIAECEKLDAASKETSQDKYFIKGVIVDDPTADYCNFNFKAGEKSIKVYGLYTQDGSKRYGTKRDISELPVKKGDEVILFGNLQNFTGTLEITNARLVVYGPAPEEQGSEGQGTEGGGQGQEQGVTGLVKLTVDGLPTAYPKAQQENTINGLVYVQGGNIANYGDGIQFQKNAGAWIKNKTAFESDIKKITINFNKKMAQTTIDNQTAEKGCLKIEIANNADFTNATVIQVNCQVVGATSTLVFDITATGCTYIKISSNQCGAVYCDLIEIQLSNYNPAN